MYSFPSTSQSLAPWALAIKTGVPPTAPNARTGELTPPGNNPKASSKNFIDWFIMLIFPSFVTCLPAGRGGEGKGEEDYDSTPYGPPYKGGQILRRFQHKPYRVEKSAYRAEGVVHSTRFIAAVDHAVGAFFMAAGPIFVPVGILHQLFE